MEQTRTRRGRGFNATEVKNLRSWGYEPRPDEIGCWSPDLNKGRREAAFDRWVAGRASVSIEADLAGDHKRWIVMVQGQPHSVHHDPEGAETVARRLRGPGRWWDAKRGVWRDDEG